MWFIVIGAGVLILALIGRGKMGKSSITLDSLDNGSTDATTPVSAVSPDADLMATRVPAPVYAPVTRGRPPTSAGAPTHTAPVASPSAPFLGAIAVSNKALLTALGRR